MRLLSIALLAVAVILVTACGGNDDDLDTSAGDDATQLAGQGGDFDDTPDAASDCETDAPECDDAVDEGARIREAEALLGTPEGELGADVRISRRGDETFMLTEDYVIGRFTVTLDDTGDGFVVTSVKVELTDGPITVE